MSSYPNPFNGVIHFNLTGEVKEPELRIYNINGEEMPGLRSLMVPAANIPLCGTEGILRELKELPESTLY